MRILLDWKFWRKICYYEAMFARFIRWYAFSLPAGLMTLAATFLWHFWHVFAISRHFKQLFVPWKRISVERTTRVFSLSEWFDVMSYNVISRIVGAVVRIFTMFFGLCVEVLTILVFGVFFLVWLLGFVTTPIVFLLYAAWFASHSIPLEQLSTDPAAVGKFLQKNAFAREVFFRLGVSSEQYKNIIDLYSHQVVLKSVNISDTSDPEPVAAALMIGGTSHPKVQEYFSSIGISAHDVSQSASWVAEMSLQKKQRSKFWLRQNLQKTPSIGKDWSYGYTPVLDRFGVDMASTAPRDLVFNPRIQELERIEEVFSKKQQTNILLVGAPGVGKMSLCYFLATRVAEGQTTPSLSDHRVIHLDIDAVLAQFTKYEQQVAAVEDCIAEASQAGNIILVIQDIDRYIAPGENSIDISRVFEKLVRNTEVKLLATTTQSGFRHVVTANKRFLSAVELLQLNETSPEETLHILMKMTPGIEERRKVFITFYALQEIVTHTDLGSLQSSFPEEAISVLESAVTQASHEVPVRKGSTLVNAALIDEVLTQRTGVKVGRLHDQDKQDLTQLATRLHTRVVGQDTAVTAVAKALQQAAVQLRTQDKTVGAFLFLGPTGVGKTELAKSVAAEYYGSEKSIVRIDCAEFTQPSSLANLIGSPAGSEAHSRGGVLTEALRQNPATVVLFDELEKAHRSVVLALMTIFDEGYLTDARGERVSFRHSLIIATSNAASRFIHDQLQKGTQYSDVQTAVVQELITTGVFPPEFINRFDAIIVFEPLQLEEIKEIALIKIEALQQQVLAKHGVILEVTEQTLGDIIATGYSTEFGARHLERAVKDIVTQRVTDAVLQNKISRGQTLSV